MPNDELKLVVQESGLPENKVTELMAQFGTDFEKARSIVASVKDITVTSEDQVEVMNQAREARLSLKKIRTTVENTRKELKEQSLREGKAIDGAANIIKALIIPVEEHLEKQEKFAEELQKKRRAEKIEKRKLELAQYVSDVSVYDLENLSEETYQKLLADAKVAKDAQIAAEKKAEEERIEEEKKVQLHNSRKEKLIPYWASLKREEALLHFGTISEEEFISIFNTAKKVKEEWEKKQENIRKENEELKKKQEEQELALKKEREEKKELEAKIQADKEAADKKKAEEDARIAQEKATREAEEKQKLLAPDRKKLEDFAGSLMLIEFPIVQSDDAKKIVEKAAGSLSELAMYIKQTAVEL